MNRYKNSIWLIFLFAFSSLEYAQQPKLTDIIAPIKLIAGKPDTILVSDLFYSENYNISFQAKKE